MYIIIVWLVYMRVFASCIFASVCVHLIVCMHIYPAQTNAHVYVIYVFLRVYVHVCACGYVFERLSVSACTCLYVCVYVCMCANVRLFHITAERLLTTLIATNLHFHPSKMRTFIDALSTFKHSIYYMQISHILIYK